MPAKRKTAPVKLTANPRGSARVSKKPPLTPAQLKQIDAYWRASNYLTACDEFLELAEAGKPVRSSPLPAIGIAVAVSCLIAFLVCMILKGQMKSVRKGVDANVYTTAGGGLKLTDSYDHYTHTTETRRKIESDSGGGGRSSGGTVSRSGGGGHGRSGKF